MAPTPLFHVTACNCLLHPCTLTGGKIVLTYKWNPARALELIEREGVTNFSGVPTMSRELIAHPDWATRDTSSLRGMGGGGAPLQPDLVEKIDKSLGDGAPSTGYGLTETHGIVTANSARFFLLKPASCGPIMPCLDAKLVDDDGNDLAPGPDTVGQLCVRGANVIKGYLNRPDATAESIVDGWFNTGDIARIDEDGFVFIVDRAKDMVLRGGENVYCSEVESAIYEHDAVAEAAVFGVPDERLGEDVGAVIVLREGAKLDADELRAFLDGRIAKHKIPAQHLVPRHPAAAQRQRQVPRSGSCVPSSSAADRDDFVGLNDGGRIRHQPGLDGLRGLAVAAVVIFHTGLGWLPGGLPRRLAVLHDLRRGDRHGRPQRDRRSRHASR